MDKKREKWKEAPRPEGNGELAKEFGLSPMAMRLIRNRAGLGAGDVRSYLESDITKLADPYLMKGMADAVGILLKRSDDGLKVRIIGDYDIDGVNSTYILLTGFTRIGIHADTVIPHRIRDGYGINREIIENAARDGIHTVVTCDNGIAAHDEIQYAKELGLTVIVTDHHDVPYKDEGGRRNHILPPADVVVNPKQPGCAYPFKKLCGAAVAWRLVECLYDIKGIPKEEYYALAECAAVATVGDVMDLEGENRTIVKYGLKRLENTSNKGYRALIKATNLDGKPLGAYHIGFVLGPCINASGRLDSASKALNLLKSATMQEAETLALELSMLNEKRKSMTENGVREASRIVEETSIGDDRVLVIYLEDCHESVAGIVAGRIRERFNKPCFVLTPGEECVKGSGRSIDAYQMFDEMTKCADVFIKFGGHPKAAGLSVESSRVDELRRRLNENCTLTQDDLSPVKEFDAILPIKYASRQIVSESALLEPCGNGNRKAVFAAAGLTVREASLIGRERNVLRAVLEDMDGTRRSAVAFHSGEDELHYIEGRKDICILYRPDINEYRGAAEIQLIVDSWMRAEDGRKAS